MMKKEYRIKKYSEIDAIFKVKQTKSDGFFSIYQKKDVSEKHFRFALSIGKKYGNAVARNKIKRQIRMIISKNQHIIIDQHLFVIVIKPKANTLSYSEIETSIESLLKKSKLLENKNA